MEFSNVTHLYLYVVLVRNSMKNPLGLHRCCTKLYTVAVNSYIVSSVHIHHSLVL